MRSLMALSFLSFLAWAVVASLAIAILLGMSASGHADGDHKRVMILHSVGREFRPWNVYAKDIRAELDRQTRWPIDVQEHSLVAARSGDPRAEELFVEYIKALYVGAPPDLIVSIGAPSAAFFQRRRKDLFPTTPIVFTVVEDRRVQYSNLTANDTVVSARNDFRFLFESYLGIAPDTKIIAIINGNSPNEQFWQGELRRELKPLEDRIEIRWYDKLSYEDTLKQTASLPPHSAIFWYQMVVDAAGVAHEGDRARWSISESRLSPDSTIYFREPTAWEQYSWQIASIVAVILTQAGLISVLLREHRRRKFSEVQSRQRMAELAHVNRFSTAGELTASIAHEINQPLGSIMTNAETANAILKSPTPDIAELKDIVNDILLDDRRAAEVIRRMRSLLKKAPFELKNIDLNDLVRETVEFLSSLAVGRKFELVSLTTQNALPILGDRIQLQQVILNLVVNGIDAMRDTPGENRIISVRTSRVENSAQLSVSDRGSGIPEDKLEKVFAPFFTSKAEGMGMGLSIAHTIIEAHHGLISAKNRDHGGATFRIKLPLVGVGFFLNDTATTELYTLSLHDALPI